MLQWLYVFRGLKFEKGDSAELSQIFNDKRLIVVVAGQVVDRNARAMLQEKVAEGWRVWLPDGSGLALGDACFQAGGHETVIGQVARSQTSASALPTTRPSVMNLHSHRLHLPLRQVSWRTGIGWK